MLIDLYIHGAGYIAPEALPDVAVSRLSALEPDYTGFIPPMQLRRMSKAVRMGIGASRTCLEDSAIDRPQAIAVGTAMGCVADTEVFLRKMMQQEEQMLTPTAFIQSTHNTVAGQIALGIECHGYNTTVVQRGHSFEGAVLSAGLYLAEHPEDKVLAGGVDELTDTSFALLQRAGVYTPTPFSPSEILSVSHEGAFAGEGAGFVLLSKQPEKAKAKISRLYLFTEREYDAAVGQIQNCLADWQSGDVIIAGAAGDKRSNAVYNALDYEFQLCKHQTGEWGTAIAVAIAKLTANWPQDADRVWILNNYGRDFSVWLLEKV
jgi:hypothetical protein